MALSQRDLHWPASSMSVWLYPLAKLGCFNSHRRCTMWPQHISQLGHWLLAVIKANKIDRCACDSWPTMNMDNGNVYVIDWRWLEWVLPKSKIESWNGWFRVTRRNEKRKMQTSWSLFEFLVTDCINIRRQYLFIFSARRRSEQKGGEIDMIDGLLQADSGDCLQCGVWTNEKSGCASLGMNRIIIIYGWIYMIPSRMIHPTANGSLEANIIPRWNQTP